MNNLPIFMYHHISESPQGFSFNNSMWVSSDHFERQMFFLYQKGYRCLSLLEFVNNWREGKPQPKHSFVLTLDDGFADNYENAFPILKKFEVLPTIFVVVKRVEDDNKHYLSWQEMRKLAQHNFIIGSHTLSHPKLSLLDDMALKRELQESKKILEDRLEVPVDLLAYPYGDVSERIQDAACEAGYLAACGVDSGYMNLFNLWRVPSNGNDSELALYWKAIGGYYLYTWLREMTYFGRKLRAMKRKILEKKRML